MAPEGMVHALNTIHSLLSHDGRLVDIHPHGELAPIYSTASEDRLLLGYIQETDDYIEYRQATAAIQQAVRNGWYRQGEEASFNFSTYAGSLEELRDHLQDYWGDAVIDAQTWQNAAQAGVERPQNDLRQRLQLVEYTSICWLQPLPYSGTSTGAGEN